MMTMMMGSWLILPLILIAVAAFAFAWRTLLNRRWPSQTNQAPLEILKARYAGGEITREEYDQIRQNLES